MERPSYSQTNKTWTTADERNFIRQMFWNRNVQGLLNYRRIVNVREYPINDGLVIRTEVVDEINKALRELKGKQLPTPMTQKITRIAKSINAPALELVLDDFGG